MCEGCAGWAGVPTFGETDAKRRDRGDVISLDRGVGAKSACTLTPSSIPTAMMR